MSAAVRIGKFASRSAASPESRRPKSVSGYFAFGLMCTWPSLPTNRPSWRRRPSACFTVRLACASTGSGSAASAAERADRVVQQLAGDVPDVVRAEAVVGRARERGDRDAGGRERGEERAVEREALHRVLLVADHVEQSAEPAGAGLRVERADLPEVARGEVRLVGMGVADRREDRQPPARVEPRERLQRRMPVQSRVGAERRPVAGLQREGVAQLAVARVAGRVEERERVPAAGSEDRHEHAAPAAARRCGARDALVEHSRAERRGAVHGQRRTDRAREERPAVEAGAGGSGHPGLDRGQTLACLGDGPPEEGRARELVAAVHAVCISGEAATRWRRALKVMGGNFLCRSSSATAAPIAFWA